MSTLRALAVQHEDDAPPGLLADWAQRRRLELDVVRPDRGEQLPDPAEGLAFVAVLGAAASVTDASVPWLDAELRWIARADELGLPVLGICFGAQALAAALGGVVRRSPAPELGWVTVQACPGEEAVPALVPGPWFAWHEDAIELPTSARLLARNRAGVQAYSLGRHLGVQFHPEVTTDITTRWIEQARSDFPSTRIDAARLQAASAREAVAGARRAHELFDGFAARASALAGRA